MASENASRSFAMVPYYFLHVVPKLVPVAKRLGYAIALHGSFLRDLDVVAVPWTDEAVSAEELAEALRVEVHGWLLQGKKPIPEVKPHGRLAWSIHTDEGVGYIDLSVMPRRKSLAMKLTELDPRWFGLEEHGPRVGLTFKCPHCLSERIGVAFHHAGKAAMENEYILAHHGAADGQHIWELAGQEDFATLTLSPSIDASKSGHWHGYITNGEVT